VLGLQGGMLWVSSAMVRRCIQPLSTVRAVKPQKQSFIMTINPAVMVVATKCMYIKTIDELMLVIKRRPGSGEAVVMWVLMQHTADCIT